ncbi:unnamed protein product [Cuscuta campestris]|uniref:Apple domain-containing protein n=1 Tax=Cuscuta campestris TaxID=132261 RepID=A0A484LFD4_9ASTE|nr:unnamed protein product [Cuscuta campestris]
MTHRFFLSLLFLLCSAPPPRCRAASAAAQELLLGFKAAPDPSVLSFQSFLGDSNSNYSLGFLRVSGTHLALSVVHVPSSESVWTAELTRPAKWSDETELFFNGSLVLSDRSSGVVWSTCTDGHRVWLSNTSNLQIQRLVGGGLAVDTVLWQSFDFPANTLVENQNFTSAMALISSNGLYSMQLGFDFIGLYKVLHNRPGSGLLYWTHRALQAKAKILEGHGPIYATLTSNGYLGMYQNRSVPVDVDPFSSYQIPVPGARRLRIEDDGNLNGYFWTGSSWVPDYIAIPDPCELPNACGSFGLCHPGGKGCSCLDNSTTHAPSGTCISPENQYSGERCREFKKNHRVVRRNGVDLPFKELRNGYRKTESWDECESACEANCACRGAVYSNASGLCYTLDYPVMTLVSVADETKMGYFKVSEGELGRKRKVMAEEWAGFGMVCGAIFVICGVGGWWCRSGMGKSGYRDDEEEEDSVIGGVGPYKHLGAESFRSIELSQT